MQSVALPFKSLIACIKDSIFNDGRGNHFTSLGGAEKEAVCQVADEQSIGRFLYFYYKDSLPYNWNKKFGREFLGASANEMKRFSELKKILKIFSAHNIFAAPLKGNHVAYKAYPNPALRTMCDIDLLLRKKDINKAYNLLIERQYKQTNEVPHEFHKPGLRSPGGTYIELHFHIMKNRNRFADELLWTDSYKSDLGGAGLIFLSPEITFLHAMQHAFSDKIVCGLKLILDSAYIIKNLEPDPEKLLEFAKKSRLTKQLKILMNILPGFFPQKYNMELSAEENKIAEKARFLLFSYNEICKTTNQERAFERDFAGRNLKTKLRFILKSVFKNPAAIAYKYKCEKSFPGIVYYYFVSIYEGFIIFVRSLSEKDKVRRQIGKAQQELVEYIEF